MHPEASTPSVPERRASVRHPASGKNASVRITAAGVPSAAVLHDVSTGGLALLTEEPLVPGTVVQVEFPDAAAAPPRVQIRLNHVSQREDGRYVLGGPFLQKPNGFDLLALLV